MDEAVRCAPSIVTIVVLNLPPPPPLSRFVFLFISSRVRRPLSCRDLQHEAISAMAASDPGSTKTKPSQILDYIAPQGGNKVREILVNYLLEKSDEMQKLDNFQSLDEFHLVIHQRQSQFHLVIHQRQDFYLKKDRAGGYTRLLRTRIRVGDAAPMAYIEFIDRENELRQAKPLASQPPQRPPLDPWTKSRLSRQFAPPKEDKSSESDA